LQIPCPINLQIHTSAYLIAEIKDIHRFKTSDKLAKHAGIAPVPNYSGGEDKKRHYKNKLDNRDLHDLFYDLAIRQLGVKRGTKEPNNPVFYELYNRKIKEGKSKQTAILCIARRLVNIIYGMLKHNRPYIKPEAAMNEKKVS
jgi:transposase